MKVYQIHLRTNKKNLKKSIYFFLTCIIFLFNLAPVYPACDEFNLGTSQSALNIQLDKDKFFELTYSDIARTKRDDFTISFTPQVKQTLRDASKSSNQILFLIIKYDKSEPARPLMLPLIRFFVPGSLGTTNLRAESTSSDDCKEVHNFNISVPEAKELFQNGRLDFDLLINVLSQGPANRIGQKFRITICLNCPTTTETAPTPESTPGETPTGGGAELPLPELDPLSTEEEALESLKKVELLLDKVREGVSLDLPLATKVDDLNDIVIGILSKIHGSIGLDSNANELGTSAISELETTLKEFDSLLTSFKEKGISSIIQENLNSAKNLVQATLTKLKEPKENS